MAGLALVVRPLGGVAAGLTALAIGAAGRLLFHALRLPLPWMMGAMVATTVASMAGVAQAIPPWSRPPTIAVLGVLLGSSFTREMAARMPDWLPSLASLPVYILVIGVLALAYLRKIAELDPLTAFSAPLPAGSARWRSWATERAATCAPSRWSTPRILLIVLTVPLAFRLMGYLPPGMSTAPPAGIELLDLAVLAVCGVLGVYGGQLLGLPAAGLLGPMVLSAAAHLLGLVEGSPPGWLVAAARW